MLCFLLFLGVLLAVCFKSQASNALYIYAFDPENGTKYAFTGCGKSGFTDGLNDRIIGGKDATQRDWPWHVVLEMALVEPSSKNSSRVRYFIKDPICGASLINKNWVLTAAHCVYRFGTEKYPYTLQLVFGNGERQTSIVERTAKDIFVHPYYEHVISQMKSDLALVLLNESVHFTTEISPVCLPDTNLDLTGHTAFVTGHGLYKNKNGTITYLKLLQSAEMEILHNSECLDMLSNDEGCPHCKRVLKTSDSVICAGLLDGSASASRGDSGGPLVVQRFDGIWTQVGVVSSGHPEYKFGLFTKISKHLSWIDQVMRAHSPREETEDYDGEL